MMMEAMWKVLGPIAKELESDQMTLTSAEDRRAKESTEKWYRGNSHHGSSAAASQAAARPPRLV